jgi:hypothetical protein
METKQPNLIDKFKALPKGQRIAIIIGIIIILSLLGQADKNNSSSSSRHSNQSEDQTATCDYCGKSFYRNSGVQLSGHSEVFCGSTCAQNWGIQHDIGVK